MEYLTVRETSEKWGMSIRMVNYYLNTGRIEGAVRKKSEWLIPYTAKSPLDRGRATDNKGALALFSQRRERMLHSE